MNAIVERSSTAVAAAQKLKQGLQNVKASTTVKGGDGALLRLLKSGIWVYGAENVEVQEGSLWAINPMSIKHGSVAWTDYPGNRKNEIVGEVMVSAFEKKPTITSLPDVGTEENGAAWTDQISFELRCMNGEDVGQQVLYKTTSHGGLSNSLKLVTLIEKQLTDEGDFVPAVELKSESYQHQKYGETFTPIFDVRKWLDIEQTAEQAEEAAAEPEPATAPAAPARQRRAPASVPETGKGEAAPKGDDKAARLAALRAQLAAEEGEGEAGGEAPAEPAPAAAAPKRRRRAAA